MGHMTLIAPLQGRFVILGLKLATIHLSNSKLYLHPLRRYKRRYKM